MSEVFINFPEPPADRDDDSTNHLLNPDFMRMLARVVKMNGKVTIVTDNLSFLRKLTREISVVSHDGTGLYASCLPPTARTVPVDTMCAKGLPEGHKTGSSYFDRFWRARQVCVVFFSFLSFSFFCSRCFSHTPCLHTR